MQVPVNKKSENEIKHVITLVEKAMRELTTDEAKAAFFIRFIKNNDVEMQRLREKFK